jgi:hypothetical protein
MHAVVRVRVRVRVRVKVTSGGLLEETVRACSGHFTCHYTIVVSTKVPTNH